jgi:hypothetical protein
MENQIRIALMALMAFMVSCGGGGPAGTTIVPEPPGGSTNLVGSFDPDDPNPGTGTVSMSQGSATSGDVVMVQVDVTGISNLFGVNFDVVYNPALADYLGDYPGDVMESGGHTGHYVLTEQQPGRIVAGVARENAGAGGVNVTTTQALVTLAFQVTGAGSSTVSFENFSCEDANLQTMQGISWAGGTLAAN